MKTIPCQLLEWKALKKKLPTRALESHKGDYGHVLVVGGAPGYSGAVRLAAESALRMGAGLVSVATHPDHAAVLNIGRPELMVHAVKSSASLLPLIEKASVILVGPGLGQDTWSQALFDQVKASHKPLVVDADALNLLAKQPFQKKDWILTPHPAEAARLLGKSHAVDIQQDREQAIFELQQKYHGVIVLKGAKTLVTNGRALFLNNHSNPALASGGTGDVLAGMIAGLVAQHLSLVDAATIAVTIHSLAADKCGATRGVLASDLWHYFVSFLNE